MGGGLISARAGNTTFPQMLRSTRRAHPRSRGEHRAIPVHRLRGLGSSPLTRGTRYLTLAVETSTRLIPAHAGNTHRRRLCAGEPGVHPRSRGEHAQRLVDPEIPGGSSPLALGIPIIPVHPTIVPGFIPAHAGNTVLAETRGEAGYGSSPLAQGT